MVIAPPTPEPQVYFPEPTPPVNTALAITILDRVNALKEPLGLDRWSLLCQAGPIENATASCSADPEYKKACLQFDVDSMDTGDDLDEVITHEMTHCHTWPLHTLAEQLALALAEAAPKYLRKALRKKLLEEVRKAGEEVTTDVGHVYLRLARRAGILAPPAVS